MENNMNFLKTLNRITTAFRDITSHYIFPKTEIKSPKRYFYRHIYSSFGHSRTRQNNVARSCETFMASLHLPLKGDLGIYRMKEQEEA